MNKERLLNVAKALRESPAPDKFNMNRVSHACGSPACAIGHYVARQDLQSDFLPVPPGHSHMDREGGTGHVLLTSGKVVFFTARSLLEHFDLDSDEYEQLFGGGYGCGDARTAIEAAEYIERFVARAE